MEELKKITAGVDVKSKPRLYIIKQIIPFVTMRQVSNETNYDYFYRFNSRLQNLILVG